MFSNRIGEELDCIVSGLTSFGIFVQCIKFGVEGLIEFGDLGLDEWKYDENNQAVVGVHSGKSIHPGQDMRVKIVAVSVPGRRLTLAPVKLLVSTRQKFNSHRNRKKAKQSRKQRRGKR
jgi:ribonuclease R